MVHTQGAHSPYHHPRAWNHHQGELDPRHSAYLNLVEFVDAQFGRFLDRLDDDALLVVTSDHGEALGEDGQWGHQINGMDLLYEVPLIINGASSPLKQMEKISHIDVHEWLRDNIAPTGSAPERSERIKRRLEALGYVDGSHTV